MSGSVVLRMTRTVDGSLNGRECCTYRTGEVYELPDQGPEGLASVFLREGWAERVVAVITPGGIVLDNVAEIVPPVARTPLPTVIEDILKLPREEIERQARERGIEHPEQVKNTERLARQLAWAAGYLVDQLLEDGSLTSASLTPRRCQATTKAGTQCQRDAEPDADYCSLPSHRAQADA